MLRIIKVTLLIVLAITTGGVIRMIINEHNKIPEAEKLEMESAHKPVRAWNSCKTVEK